MSAGAPGAGGGDGFRSGFVAVIGRPNVGKSTLVNALVGAKVSITSPRPQTTRTRIRGVRTTERSQIVFLDTPGLHRPRTALGERTNARALETLREVDVVCCTFDASAPIGPGDRFVAARAGEVPTPALAVLTKTDRAGPAGVARHLAELAAGLPAFEAYVPVCAPRGEGLDALVAEIETRLPPGPRYYPDGVVTDQPETALAAELLREQLLRMLREELPHSVAVTVEDLDEEDEEAVPDEDHGEDGRPGPLRLRAVIRVERPSQRGIVIGTGGRVLREAGTAARRELEALLGVRVHLETRVTVERNWQRRPAALDRLGL